VSLAVIDCFSDFAPTNNNFGAVRIDLHHHRIVVDGYDSLICGMNRANSRSEYCNYRYYVFIHDPTSDLALVVRVDISLIIVFKKIIKY